MSKWKYIAGAALLFFLFSGKTEGGTAPPASYEFDAEQEGFLRILHPKTENFFRTFIYRVQTETGWYVDITSSYRTFAHQQQLKQQNSLNASPGRSFHNYGFALDVNLIKNGVRVRKASSSQTWIDTGAIAIADDMGLEWGGRWSSYHDPVHFDIRKILKQILGCSTGSCVTSELLDLAFDQFGTNWNDIKGNELELPFELNL